MKKLLYILIVAGAFVACDDQEVQLTTSSGNINNLSIIIENDLWKGDVGEAIRTTLAAPVDGLPQEEPLFSMNQIPPKAFSGFVTKNRTYLKVRIADSLGLNIVKDKYARPQTGILVHGPSEEAIANLITERGDQIVAKFKESEIREKQRRIKKSLRPDDTIKKNLGLKIEFPTAYRYAKQEDKFFWLRKDLKNGGMNILLYEVPMNTIDADTNTVLSIIKMRDSIGKAHIPGPIDDSYMITEAAYAPYLFKSQIDGRFAYETKGTWEVKNAFMAGPFLNYAIEDKANNRYVVIEGFTFAPSAPKRDHMFELEAILKSARVGF